MQWYEVSPGATNSVSSPFGGQKYIVKPAFGTSSKDVRICQSWEEAIRHGTALNNKGWLPQQIIQALPYHLDGTDAQIIEPYIEGTEFSIDGWIQGGQVCAIVQHKLFMRCGKVIGDGLTISPPVRPELLLGDYQGVENDKGSIKYQGLKNVEGSIIDFGRKVLCAIGFTEGVFHIEGRERQTDAKLCLIEVNSRAPGGSLWKSTLLRSGYDLELVDAAIQLRKPVPSQAAPRAKYVLHYPFYAQNKGFLRDWGDLDPPRFSGTPNLTVDRVAKLGQYFSEDDLHEEAYLAFAVTYDETLEGLLDQSRKIMRLAPPSIRCAP